MTTLVVVSGLPGTGKTTLARELTRRLGATFLRVDAVESPLALARIEIGPLGYEIVANLAESNLGVGRDVVVDLVNPLPVTRAMWWDLARGAGARCVVLECVVTDPAEHRRRVADRTSDIEGLVVPTWQEVLDREYVPWDEVRDGPRTVVDMTETPQGVQTAIAAVAGGNLPITDTGEHGGH